MARHLACGAPHKHTTEGHRSLPIGSACILGPLCTVSPFPRRHHAPWTTVLHALPAIALLAPCGGARTQAAPPTVVDSSSAAVDRVFARWDHTNSPGCAL